MTIQELTNQYKKEVDFFDLELLIAYSLGKTREFVLMHPEFPISKEQKSKISKLVTRRILREPIAYITGDKEFYGLNFKVNRYTLIPRPETEMMVDGVLDLLHSKLRNFTVIDVGTGSGCIINSIACNMKHAACNKKESIEYRATDISKEALKVAKQNAKTYGLDKKIKFLHGNLLQPFIDKYCSLFTDHCSLIITANLPYLSKDIYESAPIDVKKYEPKSALYSPEEGLKHYRILLEQLKKLSTTGHSSSVTVFLEISPEQKGPIEKLIKTVFPKAQIKISKDLAGKWRLVSIGIQRP